MNGNHDVRWIAVSPLRVLFASLIGTTIEYFDFWQMESFRLCLFDIFCTPHLFASDVIGALLGVGPAEVIDSTREDRINSFV